MNENNLTHYNSLAELFQYPKNDYKEKVKMVETILSNFYPETLNDFKEFASFMNEVIQEDLEELFSRTFDVQAITTLDIGYVQFGDDYKRGELLVNLNKEHRDAGNDCGNELADNLANLLRLIPKMQNTEVRNELISEIIMPALDKIINEFSAENVNLKNKIYKKQHKTIIEQSENYGRIYLVPLTVLYNILKKDFNYFKPKDELSTNSFTKSIKSEIEID
jgi:nitrate reductase assembly molybdenum cofactor insertion protein NarJ